MASVVQDPSQVAYLASLNKPISISVMTKLSQWSFQQQLSYNAQLPYMSADFMGLEDCYDQLKLYSATAPLLASAFTVVENTLKLNLNVNKELYTDPTLGRVGKLFKSLPAFAKVFVINSNDKLSDIQSEES